MLAPIVPALIIAVPLKTEIPPPLPILPKRVIISATVTPEGSYYYQWHSTGSSNIVEYGIDRYEYANPNIDTNNYNYGVEVMNLSTNGCSTIQWLKNNPVNLSTGYTDTVVEIAPPAVTPPALSSLFTPIDEDSEEETEEPTPPSVQKNAPKVEPLAKKNEIEPSFTFYPNPATQNIYVRFNGNADQIEILNLSGVTLIKERCSGTEKEINISHLHIGLYIVKVKFGNKILTEKLQILK